MYIFFNSTGFWGSICFFCSMWIPPESCHGSWFNFCSGSYGSSNNNKCYNRLYLLQKGPPTNQLELDDSSGLLCCFLVIHNCILVIEHFIFPIMKLVFVLWEVTSHFLLSENGNCIKLTLNSCRFTFVIAFLLLLTGAALNDQHGVESMYFGNYYCYVVKPGVFAGGAVLSLASVTLGILYYLTLTAAKNSNTPWVSNVANNQGGIAMGQPQFPPQPQTSQDPVFVHEDTYMRRQFT